MPIRIKSVTPIDPFKHWFLKTNNDFYEIWNEKTCEVQLVNVAEVNFFEFKHWFKERYPEADIANGHLMQPGEESFAIDGCYVIPFSDCYAHFTILPFDENIITLTKENT